MSLTDEDKQRIRELETLRVEIRDELRPRQPESRVAAFFRHEAVLLTLGFFLTTCLGSWLTYLWKQREESNARRALAHTSDLVAKEKLLLDLTEAVAATHTACHDVLGLYYFQDWPAERVKQAQDNYWRESERWRTGSKVLRVRLAAHFESRDIHPAFEHIVDDRRELGNDINRLLSRSIRGAEFDAVKQKALSRANDIADQLPKLGARLAAEIAKTRGSE
jgi:hypothetical protein